MGCCESRDGNRRKSIMPIESASTPFIPSFSYFEVSSCTLYTIIPNRSFYKFTVSLNINLPLDPIVYIYNEFMVFLIGDSFEDTTSKRTILIDLDPKSRNHIEYLADLPYRIFGGMVYHYNRKLFIVGGCMDLSDAGEAGGFPYLYKSRCPENWGVKLGIKPAPILQYTTSANQWSEFRFKQHHKIGHDTDIEAILSPGTCQHGNKVFIIGGILTDAKEALTPNRGIYCFDMETRSLTRCYAEFPNLCIIDLRCAKLDNTRILITGGFSISDSSSPVISRKCFMFHIDIGVIEISELEFTPYFSLRQHPAVSQDSVVIFGDKTAWIYDTQEEAWESFNYELLKEECIESE